MFQSSMFSIWIVLILLSAVCASKVLIRVANNSIPLPVTTAYNDMATTSVSTRRSMLKRWILRSEQSNVFTNDKVNSWDMCMSMSAASSQPSSHPTISSTASSCHPSYNPSIDIIPNTPHSLSNAPSEIDETPNTSNTKPSHSPQLSQSALPSITTRPTVHNFSVSEKPMMNDGPSALITMYPAKEIPTESDRQNDTIWIPVQSTMPSTTKQPSNGIFSVSEKPMMDKSPSLPIAMYPASAIPTTSEDQNDTIVNPVESSIPSTAQSSLPNVTSTSSAVNDDSIFECKNDNVVGRTNLKFPSTTLNFKIGYSVESSINQSEYIAHLETQILVTAVAGALQCENGGLFFTDLIPEVVGRSRNTLGIDMNSTRTNEQCLRTIISECQIFETSFQVVVNQELDPIVAEFLGYILIRDKMDDGTFVEVVPSVDRCEYLRPLPLLPPAVVDDGANQEVGTESERLSVSPWSLATLSLLCACGVIVIAALYRKRERRNHRHMELAEDMSVRSQM